MARRNRAVGDRRQGYSNPSLAIAQALDIHTSTAREWIRVGHALDTLPLIDQAFFTNELSYAKARILTRWAEPETELLEIAGERSANRLTAAIAKHLSLDEDDAERDQRQHDERSVTVYTDANGMVIIRAVLPPAAGKAVAAAVNTIIKQVATTPLGVPTEDAGVSPDASADVSPPRPVANGSTQRVRNASADAPARQSMRYQLAELKRRWHTGNDGVCMPSLAQQRADAFMLLFLGRNFGVTTEVVIHVRGDGATFDDGTPITNSAVCQQLDHSFIRMLIHDTNRQPIDASNRRRHPTTRQTRVVISIKSVFVEAKPMMKRRVCEGRQAPAAIRELEPRCAPCHRARHRQQALTLAG